jgi:hypothetical protein
MCGKLDAQLCHVLAEECHPGGSVRLLEAAAGRKRRTAVKDTNVVQAEESSLKDVFPETILAVDPPREVECELGYGLLEKLQVCFPMQGSFCMDIPIYRAWR